MLELHFKTHPLNEWQQGVFSKIVQFLKEGEARGRFGRQIFFSSKGFLYMFMLACLAICWNMGLLLTVCFLLECLNKIIFFCLFNKLCIVYFNKLSLSSTVICFELKSPKTFTNLLSRQVLYSFIPYETFSCNLRGSLLPHHIG